MSTRFILFVAVGSTGVLIHLAMLAMLYKLLDAPFWVAQAVASVIGTSNNFFLNNAITFRERQLAGRDLIRGWISFNAAYAVGGIFNVWIAAWLYRHHTIWLIAALAGIVVATFWNFAMSSIIWRARNFKPVPEPLPQCRH